MNKRHSRIGLAGSIAFHASIVAIIWLASSHLVVSDQVSDEQEVTSISMEMMAGVAEQPQVAVSPDVDENAKEEEVKPEEKVEEKVEEPKPETKPEPVTEPEPVKEVVKPKEQPKEKKVKPKEEPKKVEKPKEKPKPVEKPKPEKPKVEKPVKAMEKGPAVKQGIVAKAMPNVPQSQTPKAGIANGNPNGKGNIGTAQGSPNGNAAKGNGNGSNGSAAASSGEINAYKATLQRALQRQANNAYPTRERMMRKMGTVTLSFTVSPSGQLTNVNVVNSSGNSNLDAAAVKAAQSTKTSPPPADFPSHVTVPVKFSIE